MNIGLHIYKFNIWILYGLIVLLYTLLNYISSHFIYSDTFYSDLLNQQFDSNSIQYILSLRNSFLILRYTVQPIVLLVKCLLLAAVIFAGAALLLPKVQFINCLRIVLLAEMLTFFANFVKVATYLLIPSFSPKQFQYFFPLSITHFINMDKVPQYLIYPLSQISLFEVGYWLLLTAGVRIFTNRSWSHALKIVACSYGLTLLLWLLVVTFFALQFS